MPARKRNFEEVRKDDSAITAAVVSISQTSPLQQRIRSYWPFAALVQYIFFFGPAVRVDKDVDVDLLEEECIKPEPSHLLAEIGLTMLKHVSSHRGLTPDLFDEYTRRQYVAKAPDRNPFGTDEEPTRFDDLDIFMKLRVLHQLSVWTLNNPERIREKMEEKDNEQTQWRIEPLGWDRDDRSYFVLDDDRLYRKTEAPPPPAPEPKSKPKPKRGTKRKRRTTRGGPADAPPDNDEEDEELARALEESKRDTSEANVEADIEEDDGFGGAKWECLAVSLAEYNEFLETIKKSKDPNEKVLHNRLIADVIPVIGKRAEAQERKVAQRRREVEILEKLATAKRSSRLADKTQKQREIQAAEDAERKRQEELVMARREQDKQRKFEEARESRMMTREQRLRDRETRRILHEEELRRLRDTDTPEGSTGARASERTRKLELERAQRALEELNEEEEEWYFDCSVCGVHGKNLDDGSHSMACEVCNVWQHSACHGISEAQAESDEFHFTCTSCKKPKVTSLKLNLGPASSPRDEKTIVTGTDPAVIIPPTQPSATSASYPSQYSSSNTIPQINGVAPHPHLNRDENHHPIHSEVYLLSEHRATGRSSPPQNTFVAPHINGVHYESKTHSLQQQNSHNSYLYHFNRATGVPLAQETASNNVRSSFDSYPAPTISPAKPRSNSSAIASPPHLKPTPKPIQITNNFSDPALLSPSIDLSHVPPNLGASPTPSLSATAGNTSIRFSPTPKPRGSPRSSSYNLSVHGMGADTTNHSYDTNPSMHMNDSPRQKNQQLPHSNRSLSPVKSSPPTERFFTPGSTTSKAINGQNTISNTNHNATTPYPSSSNFAVTPSSSQINSGTSPTKHDTPLVINTASHLTLGFDGALDIAHEHNHHPVPSIAASSPPPVLSPSVNVGERDLPAPIKRQNPDDMDMQDLNADENVVVADALHISEAENDARAQAQAQFQEQARAYSQAENTQVPQASI